MFHELVVAAPIPTAVQVGAESSAVPAWARDVVDALIAYLTKEGAAPAGVAFDAATDMLVLRYYTPFKASRACDLTSTSGYRAGMHRIKPRVEVIGEAVTAAVGKMDTVPDPKTGRTTRCDTSIPWWGQALHKMVQIAASVFTGPAGYKLTGTAMDKIQDETSKLDGRALKKWFNEAPNTEVIVWGIAHAKEFVDKAWKKTDGDWPARKAALTNLGIKTETFTVDRGTQILAALKVMLLAAFTGGIDWPFTRHVTEAILLMVYPGGIAPMIPIIEDRGHRGKQRPDKKKWATAAGPYVTETLALLEAASKSQVAAVGAMVPLVDCVARGEALVRAADIVAHGDCGPYGVCCPICRAPKVESCRCGLSDSRCANGHWWHYSKADVEPYPGKPLAERTVHSGRADHGRGPCCVNPTVLSAPTQGVAARVGQVIATAQETPWTCGPASLRAVLAHYGRDVSEPELERAAVTAPAIGARPEGMVHAAEVYGCHARAFVMNSVGELVGLLAKSIPPIVIVDSWTRPGKVGHYVVVSRIDLTRGLVTVMDPHTEGNWRVMTAKEFDERWWAKRRGKDGEPVIIRRVCVVVTPGEGMVVVGADKSPVVAPAVVPPDIRGDIPSERVQKAIALQVERLIRNDMGPLWVEHKIETVSAGTVTFVFATGFRAGRAGEVLPGSFRIEGRALKIRTRVYDPDAEVAVGADPEGPELRQMIDALVAKLRAHGVVPEGRPTVLYRDVFFAFKDPVDASIVAQAEYLPPGADLDGKFYHFKIEGIREPRAEGYPDSGGGSAVGVEAVAVTPPPAPTHGRTAKCKGTSGTITNLRTMTSVIHKIIITAATTMLTGGKGSKELIAASDALLDNTHALAAGNLRLWFNTASNEDVAAWAFGNARSRIAKLAAHPDDAETKLYASVGVNTAAFEGDVTVALMAAFAYYFMVDPFGVSDQVKLHIMQAIAILLYGGKGAVAVLNTALRSAKRTPAGLASVLAALKAYGDARPAVAAPVAPEGQP